MLELSTSTVQNLAPGQALTFDRKILGCKCGCCHRSGSSTVKIINGGTHRISFNANIAVPTGVTPPTTGIQLQVALSGSPLPEGRMTVTPGAAGQFFNVSSVIAEKTCCCSKAFDTVTIVNTGTTNVDVAAGANLVVERVGD